MQEGLFEVFAFSVNMSIEVTELTDEEINKESLMRANIITNSQ